MLHYLIRIISFPVQKKIFLFFQAYYGWNKSSCFIAWEKLKSIYIVYAVNAGERSQQQRQKEFETMKIKYGQPKLTYEEFEKMKKKL